MIDPAKLRRTLVLEALEAAYMLRAIPQGGMSKEMMLVAIDRAGGARSAVESILRALGVDAGTTSLDADALKLRILKGEYEP